jgi:hypothetical protein
MAMDAGVVESLPQRAPVTVTSASSSSSSASLSAPSAAFATVAAPDAAEKSEYEKKQREAELRRAREERRQKEEEQRRIKDHIKDMKLDRARKVHRTSPEAIPCASCVCCAVLTPRTWQYNRGGATTGTAPGRTTTSAPAPVPTAPASSASTVALLQVFVPS